MPALVIMHTQWKQQKSLSDSVKKGHTQATGVN